MLVKSIEDIIIQIRFHKKEINIKLNYCFNILSNSPMNQIMSNETTLEFNKFEARSNELINYYENYYKNMPIVEENEITNEIILR